AEFAPGITALGRSLTPSRSPANDVLLTEFARKVSTMHPQASGDQGRVGTAWTRPRRDTKRSRRSRRPVGLEALEGRILLAGNPPTTADDSFVTPVGVTLNVPAPGVLGNDTDPESDPLTAVLVGTTGHGTLNLNSNGSFDYMPNAGFRGVDTFTYKAND